MDAMIRETPQNGITTDRAVDLFALDCGHTLRPFRLFQRLRVFLGQWKPIVDIIVYILLYAYSIYNCIYIYIIYIYVLVYIYIYISVHTYWCIHIYIHTHTSVSISISISISSISIGIYVLVNKNHVWHCVTCSSRGTFNSASSHAGCASEFRSRSKVG